MSLQFIIGRSGSGKSTYCIEQICNTLRNQPMGNPIILLVPEQASFKAEHSLVTAEGISGIIRAQVLSFRRMAHRVLQETGGLERQPLDDTGKKMLLFRILEERKETLELFHTASEQIGTMDAILDLINELKRYALQPEELIQFSLECTTRISPVLAAKLHDLSLIYQSYETALTDTYLDAEDMLNRLAEQAKRSNYLTQAEIWIDGFHGFTPQELAVVRSLMACSRGVKITLCVDREYSAGQAPFELDLFHPPAQTMIKLQEAALELEVDLLETVKLTEPYRFQHSPMLAHLERSFDQRIPAKLMFNHPVDREDIHINAAMNRRAEVEGVARELLKLAREKAARWRDCVILVRNVEDYEHILADVLQDFEIPYFLDQKRSVVHHPLVEFIRSALEVVRDGWRYDSVFRCIKTDFFLEHGSSPDRSGMDELENYVLAYGIQGNRWGDARSWGFSPSARYGASHEDDERLRERIMHARDAVYGLLFRFQQEIAKASTIQQYILALYSLLEDVEAAKRLENWSIEAAEGGQPELAREHTQVWNRLMEMFDQMVEVMADQALTLELFSGLIQTGTDSIQLGHVPPALDQVLIGSVDRSHPAAIQYAFILGVNDGIFPQKFKEGGFLSEQERERIIEEGIELAPSSRRKLLDEQFIIYHAFTLPSHRLYLSYAIADDEGKALLPSEMIRRVKRMFPHAVEERFLYPDPPVSLDDLGHLSYAIHPHQAMAHLVVQLRHWLQGTEISTIWWDVYNWLATQPVWKERLEALMYGLFYTNEAKPLDIATSRALYGTHLRTSVSRMESFAACPFSHFASYGLRLHERSVFRLEAPDIGQLFHAALSQLATELMNEGVSWGELTAVECQIRAERIVDELAPRLQGQILLSSKRYAYISHKLKQIVGRASTVLGEHARRGDFMPVGLEVGFGPGQVLPSLKFELSHGSSMEVIGRIDRVDSVQSDAGLLIRVIDYKSSRTMLRLSDIYYGLSLQMLTYLDVVLTFSEHWLGQAALPAGVLYFHVHLPLLQTKNPIEPQRAENEVYRRFQMKGYVTADANTLQHMDQDLLAGSRSEIIPVAMKTDGGFYKYSTVVTPEQWTWLRKYVRKEIQGIGNEILSGKVSISPYRSGQQTPCQYCAYRAICQFDTSYEENVFTMLSPMDQEQFWQGLEQRSNALDAEGGGSIGSSNECSAIEAARVNLDR